MSPLLPLLVAIPLGAGFLLALLPAKYHRLSSTLALISCIGVLVSACLLFGYEGEYHIGGWMPPLGINLKIDGFSSLLMIVTAIVMAAAILYSVRFMESYTSRRHFYALSLLMLAGMNGTLLSGDIFNRYVYVEVAVIASYVLVGFGCSVKELKAALKYAILGAIASVATLLGIALLYSIHGTVNIDHLAEKIAVEGPLLFGASVAFIAALLMLLGYGFKAALMPMHIWQPNALQAAALPVSSMLAGALTQVIGVYAIIRTIFAVYGASVHLGWILLFMGLFSAIGGAAMCLFQKDYKRFLSYNSISQTGFALCGFGFGCIVFFSNYNGFVSALALTGGVFHLVSHSLSNSLLFFNHGLVLHNSADERTNIIICGKLTAFGWLAGALNSAGVPPFSGFFSKAMIITSIIAAGYYLTALFAATAVILVMIAFLRFYFVARKINIVMNGCSKDNKRLQNCEQNGEYEGKRGCFNEAPLPLAIPIVLFSVFCLLLSFLAYPPITEHVLRPAQNSILEVDESEATSVDGD